MIISVGVYISDQEAILFLSLVLLSALFSLGVVIVVVRALWLHRKSMRAARAAYAAACADQARAVDS